MYEVHNGDFAATIKKLDDEALERMKKEALASSIEHNKHSKSGNPKHKEQKKKATPKPKSKYGNLAGAVIVMIVIMILTSSLKILPFENRIILPLLIALLFAWIFHLKKQK